MQPFRKCVADTVPVFSVILKVSNLTSRKVLLWVKLSVARTRSRQPLFHCLIRVCPNTATGLIMIVSHAIALSVKFGGDESVAQ